MRRCVLIPAVLVLLAVAMPAVASAQGAPDFRDRFTDEFTDDDFCGTGASVDIAEKGVFNVWARHDRGRSRWQGLRGPS